MALVELGAAHNGGAHVSALAAIAAVALLPWLFSVAMRQLLQLRRAPRPRGPRNVSRMPYVDHDGLRNTQARSMGINPRGHR